MAFSLIPDGVYPSVYQIGGKALARQGITLLLADLDNTLAKYGQPEPDPALLAWKEDLAAAGVDLFLALGIPFLGHAGKPKSGGYLRAMERMGRTSAQTAMVGDQIFTDILGAKRTGMLALMVEPIQLAGNPGRYLRYAVEEPFRALGRRRTRKE